jgi:predicted P-loop ATPase
MLQCFLVGSVARTYCPGSKVDTILTLFSARQGRKKTLFFSSLFYGSVYAGYIDTRDKDTVLCANTSLCTLIDEVDEFTTRSEWPAVKRWVSEPESTFRAPYARRPRKWPRRFVIGATTNRDDILRDETGSRRWHILSVGPKGIDTRTDRLIEMRDQLWAEAKEVYLGGTMQCTREPTPYLWWLTPEEEERREAGAKNYEERTIIDEKVDAYVRGLALRPVRLQDVLEHALGVEHAELGRDGRLEHRAAAALRRAGYESRGGRAGRVWTHRDAPTQLEVAT